MAIWDDIKFQFKNGGILNQLLMVNAGAFVLLKVIKAIGALTESPMLYYKVEFALSLPASLPQLILQPWSLITHMFVHDGFWHLLVNLVFLYLTGRIFLMFHDSKRLLSTYIIGGLVGAFAYLISMNVFPMLLHLKDFSIAMGSSAAALSIALAAAVTAPNQIIYFMWQWPLKLKYIAGIYVLTDILMLTSSNVGGHIAHLGGALFGFVYAFQIRKGKDLTVDFLRPIYWLRERFSRKNDPIKVVHSKPKSRYQHQEEKANKQEQVDAILDKIKRSGYDSLSKKEKEILFRASKEI